MDRARIFAFVDRLAHRRRLRLSWGLPPELAPGEAESGSLPLPDVVVLLGDSDGSASLQGLTRIGDPCGDTWHPSVEDARLCVAEEYGDEISVWREVPDDVVDPLEFAVEAWTRERGSGT